MSPIKEKICDLFWFFSFNKSISRPNRVLLFKNSQLYSLTTCTIAEIKFAALPTKSQS